MESEIIPEVEGENTAHTAQSTTIEDGPQTSSDLLVKASPKDDNEAQGSRIPSLANVPLESHPLIQDSTPYLDPVDNGGQSILPPEDADSWIKVESDHMDGILPTQVALSPTLYEHVQRGDSVHHSAIETSPDDSAPQDLAPEQPMVVDEPAGIETLVPNVKEEKVENIEGDAHMSVEQGLLADPVNFQSTGRYECRLILSGHTLSISSLKFSPDGKMLASSSADKTVKLWDAETGQIIKTFEGHTSGISDVAWANDSEFVASASDDKTIRIWSLDMGGTAKVLIGHTNFVFCLNYNPSGSLLASGGYDESVRIWDVARGKTTKVLPAHSDPVTAVSFNHDGTLVVSCAMDGLVRIWDTDSGQCLKTLVDDDNPVCSHVRFSPNSKFILVSTQDSTVRLWSFDKSRPVKSYVGHANKTYCIFACFGRALSDDGISERQVVISGSEDNKVYIWDLQSRRVVQALEGHRDAVLAVAMHPTQKVIASASKERDLSIRLWHS